MATRVLPPHCALNIGIGAFLTNFFFGKPPLTRISHENVAKGWGTHIAWGNSVKEGLEQAKKEQKPLMLVVHQSHCPACRALKVPFSQDREIAELSKNLVMVNANPVNLPRDVIYSPDGMYVPRILFFSPAGKLLKNVVFSTNKKFKYAYETPSQVAKNMELVIKYPYSASTMPLRNSA